LVADIADVATQEEEDGGGAGENGDKPKRTYARVFLSFCLFYVGIILTLPGLGRRERGCRGCKS